MYDDPSEVPTTAPDFTSRVMSASDLRIVRKDPEARQRLEEWLQRMVHESQGGDRIVQFLLPHGEPALRLLKSSLALNEQTLVAKAMKEGGEAHVLFQAARKGQVQWMAWMTERGADLTWRDRQGYNLAAHLFRVQDLQDEIDALPIGKRDRNKVSRMATRWIKQQDTLYDWVKKRVDNTFWRQRGMGGEFMEDLCEERRRTAYEWVWKLAPEARKQLLNTHVAGPGVSTPKTRM